MKAKLLKMVWLISCVKLTPDKSESDLYGRTRLIRSHSSPRFSLELSGNSNYNMKLLLYPLTFDEVLSKFTKLQLIMPGIAFAVFFENFLCLIKLHRMTQTLSARSLTCIQAYKATVLSPS